MVNRLPKTLWGIVLVYTLFAILYATVTPLFEKPDENWHFAAAMYILENGTLPKNTLETPDHYAQQQANQPPLYYMTLASLWRVLGLYDLTPGYLVLAKTNEQTRVDDFLTMSDNRRRYVQGNCIDHCIRARTAAYVGRAWSAALVGLSLIFSGLAIHLIFPKQISVVLLTVALIAFNPQVLHIGTSVSNDSLIILLMSVGFYLAARWLTGEHTSRLVLLMGLVAGAALLAKLSGATLGLMFGLLLMLTSTQRWRHITIFGFVSLITCGWWLVMNWTLYGDPTALNAHIHIAHQVGAPETATELIWQFRTVIRSFWAEFGWGHVILPETVYTPMIAFIFSSFMLGLLRFGFRWWKLTSPQRSYLLFSFGIFIIVFVLLLRWMTTTQAPHGRLLFPALLSITFFMAIGLNTWVPVRWRQAQAYAIGAILISFALWMPFQFISPAYATPKPIVPSQIGIVQSTFYEEVHGGGIINVRDVSLVQTTDRVYVQVSWQVEAPLQADYLVFVHLLDANGNIIAQQDTYPGLANRPFTLLNTDDVLDDIYPLELASIEMVDSLRFGLYRTGDQANTWIRLNAESNLFMVIDRAVIIPLDQVRLLTLTPDT